ncbi:threonine/serine exporter family protein [Pasteurella bettyae]|uniref:Phage holin-like family protein n=1 Tax=Pasteurella bettyae CCUG 2042 TaxID=1095749 RepID=I3DJH6_9PAST|nr:threonine/serine exporter family protein [Pasteurella bettyae]EIJ71869.1 phage holin-like family protein [Pasteurella bettyae CCUG 2042]SUB22344.1 putative transmembrane protein [Pasteurella bettyae]
MNLFFSLIDDMIFAAIPAVGFALIFNVPNKALYYCAILGALGHSFRSLLIYFGAPIELATFLASGLIGFIGVNIAQRYLAHPKVFTVAAIIPMIPGVYAYKAMIAIVKINSLGSSPELFAQMIDYFIKAGFILGALVFGLALPRLLFYRGTPVV